MTNALPSTKRPSESPWAKPFTADCSTEAVCWPATVDFFPSVGKFFNSSEPRLPESRVLLVVTDGENENTYFQVKNIKHPKVELPLFFKSCLYNLTQTNFI